MALKSFKYNAGNGLIAFIRLEDTAELKKAYGAEPEGDASHEFHVKGSKNANQVGINPRQVRWQAQVQIPDSDPARYVKKDLWLPVLDSDTYNTLVVGSASTVSFTHDGLTYKPKRKKNQRFV